MATMGGPYDTLASVRKHKAAGVDPVQDRTHAAPATDAIRGRRCDSALMGDRVRNVGKRSFLLSCAHRLPLNDVQLMYDDDMQISVMKHRGITVLPSTECYGWTESKTFAAPGDDDPDPEDEGCY